MSKLMEAALDPSCLLCLTPGGWWSPLRQGVIWPGGPRNFATEPGTFYDAAVFTPSGVTFNLEFAVVDFAGTLRVGPWGCPLYGGGIQPFFYTINAGVQESIYPFGTLWIATPIGSIVRLTGVFSGGALQATLAIDGVTIRQSTTPVSAGTVPRALTPVTNANVTGLSASIGDGAGKTVWFHPSLSERLRLITCVNVLNDGTRFRTANASLGWSIKTALPAGLAGTVLAQINGAAVTDPAQWSRDTATFTGAASNTLEWLMVFDAALTAGQIARLSN